MQKIRSFFLKLKSRASGHEPLAVLFGLAWRLSILALPWQARWYREASLVGWPWEQGGWAIYASWIPIAATIILGLLGSGREAGTSGSSKKYDRLLLWIAVVAFLVSFFASASYVASAQWSLQAGMLVTFGLVLKRWRVPVRSLAVWFVISLIPQAVLAYLQYALQRVDAIKWLGIAFQSPKQLGVAVVEFADLRYLRAYGGMPHPNILGGWLVFGVLAVWLAAWRAMKKSEALAWSVAGAVLAGALVLTYSRTAFLALTVGAVSLAVIFFKKRKDDRFSAQFGVLAMVVALAFAGILAFTQRDVLLARTNTGNRLEKKSTDERLRSYADGWVVLKAKPLFGSGPNAELASLAHEKLNTEIKRLSQPLEAPHNALFLLVVNFGILGAAVFVWAMWRFRKELARRWWIFPSLIVLAALDHYLWSYWSGMCLVAVIWLTATIPADD